MRRMLLATVFILGGSGCSQMDETDEVKETVKEVHDGELEKIL